MVEIIKKTWKKFFGSHLDFRVWQFNLLTAMGVVLCLIAISTVLFSGAPRSSVVHLSFMMVYQAGLNWYSHVSGRYQICYLATIIITFLGAFSYIFLISGGYHGFMPSFFILALVFTAYMLDGKKQVVMMFLEVVLYTSLCVYAYLHPEKIKYYDTDRAVFYGAVEGIIVVGVVLGFTVSQQFDMLKRRNAELKSAHRLVEDQAKMKRDLFAAMSHEMRTPLTVMSGYAQFAVKQIVENGSNEQTLADLATISSEAKRLAEMASNTLRVLMDTDVEDGLEDTFVCISDLSLRLVRLIDPIAKRKGLAMTAKIEDSIPAIPGNTDALTQLFWNLLQNAITHSYSSVELTVEAMAHHVKITVMDDGKGVEPDILPRIFERGVSGQNGGSGMGLAICHDIAVRHNGGITVQSESGRGTCVTVILNATSGENDYG